MKLHLTYLFVFLFILQGCLPVEEEKAMISFWTDIVLDQEIEYVLFINEKPSGKFTVSLDEVTCGLAGLINIDIVDDSDMNLELRTDQGDIVNIGMINLFAPSQGIKIKSSFDDAIFVKHDLDEPCTRVRLRW